MSTTTENQDVRQITEDEIKAFFAAKIASTGRYDLAIGFDTHFTYQFYARSRTRDDRETTFANGIDAAISRFLAQIKTPSQRAEELRQQAAKLLGEADLLDAEANPVKHEVAT